VDDLFPRTGLIESSQQQQQQTLFSDERDEEDGPADISLPTTQKEYEYKREHPFDQPPDARFLQVAIIGLPNAGKSTLVNQLVGTKISAVSTKVHTTRRNVLGITVDGSTQLVFSDSPGLVTQKHLNKHHLEHTFASAPERCVRSAGLVMVVVDAANPRERKSLSPGIIHKLDKYRGKEALLVLNKTDLIKKKRKLFDVSTRLTTGVVDGRCFVEGDTGKTIMRPEAVIVAEKLSRVEERLRRKGHILDLEKEEKPFVAEEEEEDEHDQQPVSDMEGWANFSRVFMVSAISGEGVSDIKQYLLSRAPAGKWRFPPDIVTPQSPQDLVMLTVREKLLDHLPQEIPYLVTPRIENWVVTRTGTLCVCVNLLVPKNVYMSTVLGTAGKTIATISSEARQDLSDSFRCDVSLKLIVKCTEKKKKPT